MKQGRYEVMRGKQASNGVGVGGPGGRSVGLASRVLDLEIIR